MESVHIHTATIELYKLLKLAGLAASGGDAKMAIAEGQVKVNGEVETASAKRSAPAIPSYTICISARWLQQAERCAH